MIILSIGEQYPAPAFVKSPYSLNLYTRNPNKHFERAFLPFDTCTAADNKIPHFLDKILCKGIDSPQLHDVCTVLASAVFQHDSCTLMAHFILQITSPYTHRSCPNVLNDVSLLAYQWIDFIVQ